MEILSENRLIILCAGGAAVSRALALALAGKLVDVEIVDVDAARLNVNRDREPVLLDDLLDRLPDRLPVDAQPYLQYAEPDDRRGDIQTDTAMLRRENLWREKQARALYNQRVNRERQKRKAMRGIGRR